MTVLRLADGGYIGRFAIFDKGYTIDGAPIRLDSQSAADCRCDR